MLDYLTIYFHEFHKFPPQEFAPMKFFLYIHRQITIKNISRFLGGKLTLEFKTSEVLKLRNKKPWYEKIIITESCIYILINSQKYLA